MEITFISRDNHKYIQRILLVLNYELKYIGASIYYIFYTESRISWHVWNIVEDVPIYIHANKIIIYALWSHFFSEIEGINICLEHKSGAIYFYFYIYVLELSTFWHVPGLVMCLSCF